MTDQTPVDIGGMFDPDNFVTTTALNGRRGTVVESSIIRHNYGGKSKEDATALRVVVVAAELEKPRVSLYSGGAIKPASFEGGVLVPKDLEGTFFTGQIEKKSNIADFFKFVKSSGFPMDKLSPAQGQGVKALVGADFAWKAFEKKISGEAKGYDMPAEFHGFVATLPVYTIGAATPAGAGDGATSAAPASGGNSATDDAALIAVVQEAVVKALQVRGGEIARGQLAILVGPSFQGYDNAKRVALLGLLLKDSVLSTIPGVTYDKKTVKLTQVQVPAADAAPVAPAA